MAVASLLAVLRLSRPGARLDRVLPALALPVLAMWTLAAFALAGAEPGQRMGLVFGATWTECPFLIALLSVPMFVATFWAMRGLAPTRLPLAGTAAGLLSGAVGGLVYCLHCPEYGGTVHWHLVPARHADPRRDGGLAGASLAALVASGHEADCFGATAR